MAYSVDFCTGGIASASREVGAYVAANAFDDNPTTAWDCYPAIFPEWVQYDLGIGIAKIATQYTITFFNWNYPIAWKFQGSNDGSGWTDIDSQVGQSFVAGQKKTYNSFSNSTAYRYYRWLFSSASGNDMALAELEIMSTETAIEMSANIILSSVLNINSTLMYGLPGDIWNANLSIPISLSGTMDFEENYFLSGSLPITIGMSGTISAPTQISGEAPYITIPVFTISGSGILSNVGVAAFNLPAFSMSADGIVSVLGDGAFSLPALFLSAIGLPSIIGTALITLPLFTLHAENWIDATGDLSVTLPSLSVTGTVLRGATGSLDQDIPPLTLSATGILSIEGIAAISIPMLTLIASSLATTAYLSMVLNLKNRALTLYDNYDFNSMCRFNGKHFGASKTKIYDLDSGTTDAGTLIDWNFRTGYLDLEQKLKKKLRQAWLSYKTSGDIILTVIQPDGEEYEYTLSGIDITETGLRVKFGKGIRSKYVALDIQSVAGSTITLDVLKLALEKTSKLR